MARTMTIQAMVAGVALVSVTADYKTTEYMVVMDADDMGSVVYWSKRDKPAESSYRVVCSAANVALSCNCPARNIKCRHRAATEILFKKGL